MRSHILAAAAVLLILGPALACGDAIETLAPPPALAGVQAAEPAPAGMVDVTLADGSFTLWPYISFTPQERPQDPVNLLFTGRSDPRNIRSLLMALPGTRTEPFAGFDCTWTDAIGGAQVAYGQPVGWTGSVIQLECGAFDPFRWHLRLFPAGERTIANAHVEILIPGTQEHQVLNWEAAEQFIVYEMARAAAVLGGPVLGAPPASTQLITEAPTWGEIPPVIYNLLPPELRLLAGGPLGDVDAPVGMPLDGRATALHLVMDAPPAPGTVQEITIQFGQFVPKPFCAEPGQMVRVDGPLQVWQNVIVTSTGDVVSEMLGQGQLTVRDVTLAGLGDAITAHVRDHARTEMRDDGNYVIGNTHQRLVSKGGPTEQLQQQLRVGSTMKPAFRRDERCN